MTYETAEIKDRPGLFIDCVQHLLQLGWLVHDADVRWMTVYTRDPCWRQRGTPRAISCLPFPCATSAMLQFCYRNADNYVGLKIHDHPQNEPELIFFDHDGEEMERIPLKDAAITSKQIEREMQVGHIPWW
jgi:hypothetical protein